MEFILLGILSVVVLHQHREIRKLKKRQSPNVTNAHSVQLDMDKIVPIVEGIVRRDLEANGITYIQDR